MLIRNALLDQAVWCDRLGSPLYARLLELAARDAQAGGPVAALLDAHAAPGRADALALRLMVAVHRLVLTGARGRAVETAPLAWLRLEPLVSLRRHTLALTTWPGGAESTLAECGGHGTEVTWTG